MSHTSFDFLSNSLLFDETLLREKYASVSDAELRRVLTSYRDYCIKNISTIKAEITSTEGLLRCFGNGQFASLNSLKRTALYIEQTVLSDPIFLLAKFASEFEDAIFEYAGLPYNRPVNKANLASAVASVIATKPMVVAGYVKYYPSAFYTDSHDVVLTDIDPRCNQDVPESVLNIYRGKAQIKSVIHQNGKPIILPDLHRCQEIFIKFQGVEDGSGNVYKSMMHKVSSIDREKNVVSSDILIPQELPSQEDFNDWVEKSLVMGATSHYKKLLEEISIATDLKAIFSTQSEFNNRILKSSTSNTRKGIEENAIDCVLKMQLPFMDKISTQDLMSIRINDGEEFSNFRADLEGRLRDLRSELDPTVIKEKIIDLEHELSVVQIRALDLKVKNVRRVALADVGIATIGLAAGIATSGWSLFGTLAAMVQGVKTFSEYQDKVRENPCYFLWKVHSKARHK